MALLLPACGGMQMELPDEFLRIQSSGSDELKAIDPDDARIWVREFADPNGGDLRFWSTTLENEFVRNRGYELVGKVAVEDGSGRPGQQLELRTVAGGERFGYLVSVFVVPAPLLGSPSVRVAEFAAREAVFAARVDAVRTAIGTLR